MVTLGHFHSSGSLKSNLFRCLFGFEKIWNLRTVFTAVVNLLPGVNFWVSLLLRFGGLYFCLQVIIHNSKFQQSLTFCKFLFLQNFSLASMFLIHRIMTKVYLNSHGHRESVHDGMVMCWKLFNFIAGWNLHNVSIRAWCEAPLIKYFSC